MDKHLLGCCFSVRLCCFGTVSDDSIGHRYRALFDREHLLLSPFGRRLDRPGMGTAGPDHENHGHGRSARIPGIAAYRHRFGHRLVYWLEEKSPAEEQVWPELSFLDVGSLPADRQVGCQMSEVGIRYIRCSQWTVDISILSTHYSILNPQNT